MKFTVALSSFTLFGLLQATGFDADDFNANFNVPAILNENEEAFVQDNNHSSIEFPRYVFLGTENWPRIRELNDIPFIFLSPYELLLNSFESVNPAIILGLFISEDDIERFEQMTPTKMNSMLQSTKAVCFLKN